MGYLMLRGPTGAVLLAVRGEAASDYRPSAGASRVCGQLGWRPNIYAGTVCRGVDCFEARHAMQGIRLHRIPRTAAPLHGFSFEYIMKSTNGFILLYSDTQRELSWRVLFPSTGLYLYFFVPYMSLLP